LTISGTSNSPHKLASCYGGYPNQSLADRVSNFEKEAAKLIAQSNERENVDVKALRCC
jgi:hypothetical protein